MEISDLDMTRLRRLQHNLMIAESVDVSRWGPISIELQLQHIKYLQRKIEMFIEAIDQNEDNFLGPKFAGKSS